MHLKEAYVILGKQEWQVQPNHWTYRSVPHIRPPFCNLRASRKRRGGLYAGSDILSREYAPSSVPRLDVDITLYYRPIEAADLPSLLVQKLNGQD